MRNQISKFFGNFKYILRGHILNPIWLSRVERRRRRFDYNYKMVKQYLSKYLPYVTEYRLRPRKEASSNNRYIFTIWFQSEKNAPKLVKECFKRMKYFYSDRIKILDKDSIKEWINIPSIILEKWENGVITNAHFSDICRIELLYQHGGIWLDATDYLTSPIPEQIEKCDFFMYSSGDNITPSTLIQSCFIKANQYHPLLKFLRDFVIQYWKKENSLIDYFLLHYMLRFIIENNNEAAEIFNNMPKINQDPTHLLWHQFRDEVFSNALYEKATKDTFFQKTNFKCNSAVNPRPNSVADYILNDKIGYNE